MRQGPMTHFDTKQTWLWVVVGLLAACSPNGSASSPGVAGAMSNGDGGMTVYGGSAGLAGMAAASGGTVQQVSTAVGGTTSAGGTSAQASATGGSSAQTSATSVGGTAASGGSTTRPTAVGSGGHATGGTTASVGSTSLGGAVSSAGMTAAMGGAHSGGTAAAGGAAGASVVATAGTSSATGGANSTGGVASTGGASSQVCEWDQGPSASDGGLTCYWFSQGTSQDAKTCPSGYKTYCGYCGSETGSMPQGSGQVWCPINNITDSVQNISTTHFVAIPPGPLAQGKNCGACVQVTYQGVSIIATVVNECPSCSSDQDIDLSLTAAAALGIDEQMGQIPDGVEWHIVGCPTTAPIAVNFNGGYQGQVYFQNLAFPIASATSGTSTGTANTGFWDFGKVMGGQQVTLTDVMGHTVTGTVPSSPGSLGVQFDTTCN